MNEISIDTLIGLIQHYSPSGNENSAVEYLVERMKDLGFHKAYSDEAGNAVGIIGQGERQLLFLGHIDTVPGEIPFHIEGDVIFGRGSVDAKGPLSAFVDAVALAGEKSGWQLMVIGAVEEERESLGARHVVNNHHPDMVVIGEPSRWDRITLGYKGSTWVEISTECPMSHTAGMNDNASVALLKTWQTINHWVENYNSDSGDRVFDQLTITINQLSSGDDGFNDWAKFRLGVRLPVAISPDNWLEIVKSLAPDASVQQIGYPISAYRCDKNSPLVRAFLSAIRKQSGKPGFVYKTGTADMNIVAPVWKCPAVAYGPGDSNLDHTPNEHASIDEYQKSVRTLISLIENITNT